MVVPSGDPSVTTDAFDDDINDDTNDQNEKDHTKRAPAKVRVLYAYKATHNDELSLRVDDKLTLTQTPEGGWWEGTLDEDGTTGWFPSNYVTMVKDSDNSQASNPHQSLSNEQIEERTQSTIAIAKFIHEHCNDLSSFIMTFLRPLLKNSPAIFDNDSFALLAAVETILDEHLRIETILANATMAVDRFMRSSTAAMMTNTQANKYNSKQAIGALFLQTAPRIQSCLEHYASVHPSLVRLLAIKSKKIYTFIMAQETNEENSNTSAIQSPRNETATNRLAAQYIICVNRHLSSPFRLISKFPLLLRDLERTYEESNPDRGDLQRAMQFFKNLSPRIEDVRRRKELEIEVLNAPVIGWDPQQREQLGCPLAIANVLWQSYVPAIGDSLLPRPKTSVVERIALLYSNTLVCFSYDCPQNRYKFEGKYSLSNLIVSDVHDRKRMIELSGRVVKRFLLTFSSDIDYNNWKSLLSRCTRHSEMSDRSVVRLPSTSVRPLGTCAPIQKLSQFTTPTTSGSSSQSRRARSTRRNKASAAVVVGQLEPPINIGPDDVSKRLMHCESDAMILSLIESYHNAPGSEHILKSTGGDTETLISFLISQPVQEGNANKKSFISSSPSIASGLARDQGLHCLVKKLSQQMIQLQAAIKNLKRDLEEERKARIRFEQDCERSYAERAAGVQSR